MEKVVNDIDIMCSICKLQSKLPSTERNEAQSKYFVRAFRHRVKRFSRLRHRQYVWNNLTTERDT